MEMMGIQGNPNEDESLIKTSIGLQKSKQDFLDGQQVVMQTFCDFRGQFQRERGPDARTPQ